MVIDGRAKDGSVRAEVCYTEECLAGLNYG